MIKCVCSMCGKELKKHGALLFSPPTFMMSEHTSSVFKTHLCRKCFSDVVQFIKIAKTVRK